MTVQQESIYPLTQEQYENLTNAFSGTPVRKLGAKLKDIRTCSVYCWNPEETFVKIPQFARKYIFANSELQL